MLGEKEMTSQYVSEKYKDAILKIIYFLKQNNLYLPLHFTRPNSVWGKLERGGKDFFLFLRQNIMLPIEVDRHEVNHI